MKKIYGEGYCLTVGKAIQKEWTDVAELQLYVEKCNKS